MTTAVQLPCRVHVVDDDPTVLRSISRVLDTGGLSAVEWSSPVEFLRKARLSTPTCVLLDVRMPEMTGPEVQDALRRRGSAVPVVFLTAHADVPTTVRAMKGGALDFLLKPIEPTALLSVVSRALQASEREAATTARSENLRRRLDTLTPREREVLLQLARGASNREGATALGITENTVKVHRLRVTQKMQAGSFAELVRMAVALGLVSEGEAAPDDVEP